jgi:energy-coupling factor transport system ATP-binding protein
MIELEEVSVELPPESPQAKTVLKNITLAIADGEWLAVTGANGSGKSTLLKLIAGLFHPSSGRVRNGGTAAIGLLLQEPDNQFVAQSVRTELALSLDPSLDERARRERVVAGIERFDLGRLLDRNPHRISGGEKQRLALATIWLSDPAVILLDEPASYLDEEERTRAVAFVREMNRGGVTVVWATPGGADVDEAGRVAYLSGGEIAFDGAPAKFTEAAREKGFDVLLPGDELPRAREPSPGARGEPVISMTSLAFSYGVLPVFQNVSGELREGEAVGIAGKNGSGKSTLLSIMAGVLSPTGGSIERRYEKAVARVEGRNTQQVFYLFQSPERLFFAETVIEEVAFGLASLGVPRGEIPERASRALASVGLDPGTFLARSPGSLSLGEMRRLAFAMATALEPKFLLLDEPASCLDRTGREVLRGIVEETKSRRGTVAIASHDRAHLLALADRRLTIGSGMLSGA